MTAQAISKSSSTRRSKTRSLPLLSTSNTRNQIVILTLFSPFMYAKVFGQIRVYKEEKAIVGTNIKAITKFDEVPNHFLQVFVAS
jgi:hypothetical protein